MTEALALPDIASRTCPRLYASARTPRARSEVDPGGQENRGYGDRGQGLRAATKRRRPDAGYAHAAPTRRRRIGHELLEDRSAIQARAQHAGGDALEGSWFQRPNATPATPRTDLKNKRGEHGGAAYADLPDEQFEAASKAEADRRRADQSRCCSQNDHGARGTRRADAPWSYGDIEPRPPSSPATPPTVTALSITELGTGGQRVGEVAPTPFVGVRRMRWASCAAGHVLQRTTNRRSSPAASKRPSGNSSRQALNV